MEKEKILIWDLPTRFFHWSLVASFAGASLTAESERYRDLHVLLGYTVLGLIVFRLLWGVVGTRYARFSSFAFAPRRVFDYLKSLLTRTPQHHLGHNPAGAWAIFLMLALALCTGATGYAAYNEIGGEWLAELHEGVANTMLAVVVVHVAGVLLSSLLHGENLVAAMFSGRKLGSPQNGIQHKHWAVAAVLVLAVAGFLGSGGDFSLGAARNAAPAAASDHQAQPRGGRHG